MMALMRWDAGEVERLRDDMARMWSRMREDWGWDSTRPRTHLHQIDDGYVAEFELPGVDPDLVEIDLDEESISVHGQFPPCPGDQDHKANSEFHVVLTWPTEINPESADAHWNHGLLSVQARKTTGHRRRISVQAQH